MLIEIPLPLPIKHVCALCHPGNFAHPVTKTKGVLSSHNSLKQHMKQIHDVDVQFVFKCRCDKPPFPTLRLGNSHLQECQDWESEESRTSSISRRPLQRSRSMPSRFTEAPQLRTAMTNASTQTTEAPFITSRPNLLSSTGIDAQYWQDCFNSAASTNDIEHAITTFSAAITRGTVPEAPAPITGRDSSVQEARRIQSLYRRDPKKAMAEVRKGESTKCQLPKTTLYDHFKRVYTDLPCDMTEIPECVPSLPPPDTSDPFNMPFSISLVSSRLAAVSNTAPGPDRIRYNDLKKADPHCTIITSIFNAVLRIGHVPSSWKMSTTILIHKKGSQDDIHNWRPIALSNTLGKLFSSCIAWRLLDWCDRNNRLTTAQKGFLKFEGCLEHNFMLQSVIHDARQRSQITAIAWLDLKNAFGSVPHRTIMKSLEWIGLNETATGLIKALYDGCSTRIRSNEGMTNPIPIKSGVRQGCPLSPIIFDIVMEPMIRAVKTVAEGYELGGFNVDVLAYADDVTLIAQSASGLQKQLGIAAIVADWAGLQFNAAKCASLIVDGTRSHCPPVEFQIQGEAIVPSDKKDLYRHLGIPTGFKYGATGEEILHEMDKDVQLIDASLLAPWQKVDAVRTFVISKIVFHMKGGRMERKKLGELDNRIKKCAKKWLFLPSRASTEILYLPHKCGGTNLMPLKTLADICNVVQAYHLLHSQDPDVVAMAKSTLNDDVKQRIKHLPSSELIQDYLNGKTDGLFAGPFSSRSSIWTRLRISTRELRKMIPSIHWECSPDGIYLLIADHRTRTDNIERQLKMAVRLNLAQKLAAKPDQGKVFKVASLCSASNHFMNRGNFTRFCDWRFIMRARHNTVPLRGCLKFDNGAKNCRKCGYSLESLPHVLNHCAVHLEAATKRHNAIVTRLEKVIPNRSQDKLFVNQTVPGCDSDLRPDITWIDEKNKIATIIDVAIPFESSYAAFEETRQRKKTKYEGIETSLKDLGYKTFCDAFIVGSLGSFDPANENCIRRLRIPHRYAALMKRLMVSDVIHWSRDIYIEHITGIRQFQEDGPLN